MTRCVICGLPVDVTRRGAVPTDVGTWAHDICFERALAEARQAAKEKQA